VQVGASLAQHVTAQTWDALYRSAKPVLPKSLQKNVYGDHIHKMARLMTAPNADVFYDQLVAHWHPSPVIAAPSHANCDGRNGKLPQTMGQIEERMMLADLHGYLPDDILVKVDRAAMGTSLETRVPMLDHRVAEFAWQLPLHMKQRGGQTKWVLRQVLYRHVPTHLIERPKQGFAAPIGEWLRRDLRDWAEALLDEGRLRREGFLDPQPIRQKWLQHLQGKRDWKHYLWDVLMFQAWLEKSQ
jgi:asparagine synthase (glutamine-hydrolysing)